MSQKCPPNASGQALVEMALILPMLLVLVIGLLEFGRAFNAHQAVTDAAREGARQAVVQDPNIDQDSVESAVKTVLDRAGVPSAEATVQFDRTTNWRVPSQMQTVSVSIPHRFGFFGPLMKALTGSESITIGAHFSMRNEPL